MVSLEPQVLLAHPVELAHPEHPDSPEHQAKMVSMVPLAPLDWLDPLDHPVAPERTDSMEPLV